MVNLVDICCYMIKSFLTIVFLSCCFIYASAQWKISGTIKDSNGNPIPFSSVYIKNTSLATSANADGQFNLPVAKGSYTLIFKAMGYKSAEDRVIVDKNLVINPILSEETFTVKDVLISGAEDPAYAIMRKAIALRKKHLLEVNEFTCDVYIKGMQKLLSAPKKFLGKDIGKMTSEIGLDSNRRGILYLSESESRYSFKQPNLVHEEMISSRVSGSNQAFSFNRASDLKVNFYENFQKWDGLSLRPLISPIADNAFFYYDYKYLGVSTQNGQTIFKIRLIPKRATDPVYRGVIYILDEAWRLSDVDIFLTKQANIALVDTLQIRQQFIPVGNNFWMPSSVKFDFKGGLFEFRFGGYFIAVYKNYDIDSKQTKKYFSEVMRITKDVNKKDTAYWEQNRPIPLTEEEKTDYLKKEALAEKRASKPYLDSLDKANNKFKPFPFVFGRGYTIRNRFNKSSVSLSSLKDAAFFNTVEGYGLNYGVTYRKQIDSINNKYVVIYAKARYGFTSEKFYPAGSISFPVGKFSLSVAGGGDVIDLNNQAYQSQLGNSFGSLWYQTNRLKLYEKKYGQISVGGRVYEGLMGSISAEYSNRRSLLNSNYDIWRESKSNDYTSNNPFDPMHESLLFPENQAMKLNFRLSYNFSNKYVTYPAGKFYIPSKFPTLTVGYTKGIPNVFGSDVDYDLVFTELVKNNIPMGFYGQFSFMAGAGVFLNNTKLNYTDFKHFTGNEGTFFTPRNNLFLFLDNYKHSTSKSYFELHAQHNFSGFILNKIPLIRKAKMQEIVGYNYLKTPEYRGYSELYFGVQFLNLKAYYGFVFPADQQHADLHKSKGFKLSIAL